MESFIGAVEIRTVLKPIAEADGNNVSEVFFLNVGCFSQIP